MSDELQHIIDNLFDQVEKNLYESVAREKALTARVEELEQQLQQQKVISEYWHEQAHQGRECGE